MQVWNDELMTLLANHRYVMLSVIGVLAVLLSVAAASLGQWAKHRSAASLGLWHYALLRALHAPFQWLNWGIALTIALPVLSYGTHFYAWFSPYLLSARLLLLLISLFWFAMSVTAYLERALFASLAGQEGAKQEKMTVRALSQLARVILIIAFVLLGMQALGFSISALLALGGVGGIAIGFAAQDTLANFIGGMMIFWDQPFAVGDWVRSPDRNIEGTVEHIGWRLTVIRTFDKRPLYVPNGVFSKIALENPSRMSNRRIKATIGLRYADAPKIAAILSEIEVMLRAHPEIDTQQTLMVNLIHFGDSSLDFFIYTFTNTTNWVAFQAIQQDVFLKVLAIIDRHGAACAFPARDVFLNTPSSGESAHCPGQKHLPA
jgi:MscS family membrane protein